MLNSSNTFDCRQKTYRMEEMLLRVCVVVVSLLYIKDHTVIKEQDKKVLMDMQEREYLLRKEATMLEQEVHQVTTGLPHSNQDVSKSHGRLTNIEGFQVQAKENSHEHQTSPAEDLDILPQNLLIKDIQDEEVPLTHDNMQPELQQKSYQLDQVEGMFKQMPPECHLKTIYICRLTGCTSTEEVSEEISTAPNEQSENSYSWYLWKFLCAISLIRLLRKFISKGSQNPGTTIPIKDKIISRSTGILSKTFIPDYQVLSAFYDQCVKASPSTCGRVCEFVEGLVDELLEAARDASNKETDLQIGDFIGVGSLYELWATHCKAIVCDLYVPITAPKSYEFYVELWKEKNASLLGSGKIKTVKAENTSNGCPCMDGNPDQEDTLCLLHPIIETSKVMINAVGDPLCQENTPYLSKKQVVRWFRTEIIKAWREISHKYEFELGFHSQTAPGALRVRFRSGQTILFNITPVVQVKASEVYLVSYLSTNQNISDIYWPISFANYENALLQYVTKTLPDNSCHITCLQILSFLHKQQISLTGKCALTSYHLKSTLLHLLMYKPTEWKHEQLTERLTDMLTFLEQRLQAKEFHHAFIGNSLIPKDIGLPKEFQTAKPTNIFLPMALDKECYLKMVQHFQELVKNAPVLIQEYGSVKSSDCRESEKK